MPQADQSKARPEQRSLKRLESNVDLQLLSKTFHENGCPILNSDSAFRVG